MTSSETKVIEALEHLVSVKNDEINNLVTEIDNLKDEIKCFTVAFDNATKALAHEVIENHRILVENTKLENQVDGLLDKLNKRRL